MHAQKGRQEGQTRSAKKQWDGGDGVCVWFKQANITVTLPLSCPLVFLIYLWLCPGPNIGAGYLLFVLRNNFFLSCPINHLPFLLIFSLFLHLYSTPSLKPPPTSFCKPKSPICRVFSSFLLDHVYFATMSVTTAFSARNTRQDTTMSYLDRCKQT